jgi:hypothetical protein
MAAPNITPNTHLDFLLAEVAKALQLTPSQYNLAAQHYGAMADWLGASASPLSRFRPHIYPQGSMALETTVKPRTQEEFDLDLVCQMLRTGMTAMEVYNAVYDRLRANEVYAAMIERKNRCVRLNYGHDFHLDIIPAEPDELHGGTSIQVPDRELRCWMPSNPKGYIAWFTHRTQMSITELRKRVDPLPRPTPADEKPALTIAVQLVKRRRDVYFADPDLAPRSVVLTTLAAEHYQGTDHVGSALAQIVVGIRQRIDRAAPDPITVCNPTNDDENFCDSFEGAGRYDAFNRFIRQLERDVQAILATDGIPELQVLLSRLFGEEPVTKAIRSYGEQLRAQRDLGTLKFTGAGVGGLSIVERSGDMARPVPRNTNFGGDGEQ